MIQIAPHSVWIGTIGDLRDLRRLYDLGIRAIVELSYEDAAVALPHDFVSCRFPLNDGGDNDPELLRLAVDAMTRLLERKFATVVCCHAGMSRSPAVVAAALARITGEPLEACVALIARQRPCDIHPVLLAQLRSLS
jgi:protein-tyrosine phosphatase